MDKKEQQTIDETLQEATPVSNISKEHHLTTSAPTTLAQPTTGVPISGFNELPVSMIALPYVVIVQNGTNVFLPDGKTPSPKGQWYFTDTQTTKQEVHFVSLRALVREKEQMDDNNQPKKVNKLYVLCMDMEDMELFIFSLPVTSFTAWGRMMAQMKKQDVKNSYEYMVKGTIKSAVNKRGQQFYVADFILEDKLNNDDIFEMQQKYGEYGGVLDRNEIVDEVE